jgi:peptidoglycan hydrolase FlgJ
MDIVADVLKQADAAKTKVAMQNIERLAQGKTVKLSKQQFRLPTKVAPSDQIALTKFKKLNKDQSRVPASAEGDIASVPESRQAAKNAAMRGLETVLATKMVEAMMPKDQSRIYGEGTAGEIWRGFHIDAMGKALAGQGLFSTSNDDATPNDLTNQPFKQRRTIVPFAS